MFLPDSDGVSQMLSSETHSTSGIRMPETSTSENRLKDTVVNCPILGKVLPGLRTGIPPGLHSMANAVQRAASRILGDFSRAPHCL